MSYLICRPQFKYMLRINSFIYLPRRVYLSIRTHNMLDQLPTSWLDSSVCRAVHRHHRGHAGIETRIGLTIFCFFQAFFSQLLKLMTRPQMRGRNARSVRDLTPRAPLRHASERRLETSQLKLREQPRR